MFFCENNDVRAQELESLNARGTTEAYLERSQTSIMDLFCENT